MVFGAGVCAKVSQSASVPAGAPLVVIVGGPPGTPGDLLMRTISGPLAAELRQPVVIENRPGAAGTVALSAVARGRRDGNLLGVMALQSAVAPALIKFMPYDTLRDLSPVRQLTAVNNVLVVRSDSPFRTLDDLLRAARDHELTYASGGNATPAHLAAALFAHESRGRLLHVPFSGAVAGVTALLGGHVQLMFATISAVASQVQSGKLRALATSSQERLALMPDVPTLAELGHAKSVMRDWHGLVSPAGVSADRIRLLSDGLGKVLTQTLVQERIAAQGFEPVRNSGPGEFREWIEREALLWSGIVQRAGISLQ